MDSLITAAARALAAGDPLSALNRVALRDDAPALALRGIAMAQLGDFDRARNLLRVAARAFGGREAAARARCIVAEAEIALAARDLAWPDKRLDTARDFLARHGDTANANHARSIAARRLLLIGRLEDAEHMLRDLDPAALPAALRAAHELALAEIAMRRVRATQASDAFARAALAARAAAIPALTAEIETASRALDRPAAHLIANGAERPLRLAEVEALLASQTMIVDAVRYAVRGAGKSVTLATRPVLFALVRALAETWPGDASREDLLRCAFGARHADESHRARLRVEIGRLRRMLRPIAEVSATKRGFVLAPRGRHEVAVLARPVEEKHGEVLALLADGEAWSSSALALALGTGQRSVQRALDALAAGGKVKSVGRSRALRWMSPPIAGFTTVLLLPASLPGG